MKSRVNLYLDEEIKEKAKELAKSLGISLSKLFSDYVIWREKTEVGKPEEEEIHPLVKAINPNPASHLPYREYGELMAEKYAAEADAYESDLP